MSREESDFTQVITRTLGFVKTSWPAVVRIYFVVGMHSTWKQAAMKWWHTSFIRSCLDLQVWQGPVVGEPGAGTLQSYISQIIAYALIPNRLLFIEALKEFIESMPPISLVAMDHFFDKVPSSNSCPIAIVARHYFDMLHKVSPTYVKKQVANARGDDSPSRRIMGVSDTTKAADKDLTLAGLKDMMTGFKKVLCPHITDGADPRDAVLAFLSLAAICDLRHQRRLISEVLDALPVPYAQVSINEPFWAGCFYTLLEFAYALEEHGSCKTTGTFLGKPPEDASGRATRWIQK